MPVQYGLWMRLLSVMKSFKWYFTVAMTCQVWSFKWHGRAALYCGDNAVQRRFYVLSLGMKS